MSDTLFQQLNSNSFQQDLETIKQKEKPITQTINPDATYLGVFFGSLVIVATLIKVTPIIIETVVNYCVANASTLIPTATGLVGTTTTTVAYKVKSKFNKQKQLISSFNNKEKTLNKKLEDTKTLYQANLKTLKTELESVNNLLTAKEEAISSLETDKQSALDEVAEISQKLKEVKEVAKVEPVIQAKPIKEEVEEEIDLEVEKVSVKTINLVSDIEEADINRKANAKGDKNYKAKIKDQKDCNNLIEQIKIFQTMNVFDLVHKTSWGLAEVNRIMDLLVAKGYLIKDDNSDYIPTDEFKSETGIEEFDRMNFLKSLF